MKPEQAVDAQPEQLQCRCCGQTVAGADVYHHRSGPVCDTCYMDLRRDRRRKTHWQYLRSPKDDYLRPGKST